MREDFLFKKLDERKQQNAFRQLKLTDGSVDFCSNDYLGIVKNKIIEQYLFNSKGDGAEKCRSFKTGSTGSRLLAGNYAMIEEVEGIIAKFHDAPAGLIFNSGYDANVGLLSCVPQRGDTILYDHLSHASLRDGIRLSRAQSFSFNHNEPDDLQKKLKIASGNIFVVTESVFSMDGDMAPLSEVSEICDRYDAQLVVDEAHATGVIGKKGEGLVQLLELQKKCFARVHTFGKACGVHGAIILGTELLKNFLVNFCRPLIYTTALPEATVALIRESYAVFPNLVSEREHLKELVGQFRGSNSRFQVLKSETPIQGVIVPGNDEVKKVSKKLQDNKLDVRPILYPTVPKGSERLRIVFHSFNTTEEVSSLVDCLQ